MERYFDDYNRRRRHRELVEYGEYFTYEQIRDILDLIQYEKYPDGTFGDSECCLYELIKERLHISF